MNSKSREEEWNGLNGGSRLLLTGAIVTVGRRVPPERGTWVVGRGYRRRWSSPSAPVCLSVCV
jgi:hypothetical protein